MEPMSRQVRRWFDRQDAKQERAAKRVEAAKAARRALLQRQSRREKSGFYGKPVSDAITPSRSRITSRKVKKGNAFCRILITKPVAGRELSYHATKGWRSNRVSP